MQFKHLALLAALALAACANPTPYQPAARENGHTGYSDERLADNRYRITFKGNSATRRETVENFLLLRAAEVTRDAGYAWFVFDHRDTETHTTYHADFAAYPGWHRPFGWYWRSWPYDPWDPYWGGPNAFPTTQYEAYAEIILLTPDAARKDDHAMQASDVIAHLGPQAAPPPTAP